MGSAEADSNLVSEGELQAQGRAPEDAGRGPLVSLPPRTVKPVAPGNAARTATAARVGRQPARAPNRSRVFAGQESGLTGERPAPGRHIQGLRPRIVR